MCAYAWRPRLTARPSLDQKRRAEIDWGAAAEFAEATVHSVFARLTEAPTTDTSPPPEFRTLFP